MNRKQKPSDKTQPIEGWRKRLTGQGYPIAKVVWNDACLRRGDASKFNGMEEDKLGTIQETIGFLIHKGKKFVVLAADREEEYQTYRDFTEIPTSLVLEIKKLK